MEGTSQCRSEKSFREYRGKDNKNIPDTLSRGGGGGVGGVKDRGVKKRKAKTKVAPGNSLRR